jgi:hypothetical protein
MIDPIKSLGIEKGRPFNPDATSRAALEAGARDAHDWLNYFYETGLHPYFEGTHWAVPAQMPFVEEAAKGYTTPDFYPVDARALTYYMGYIGIKHLGAGQFYLIVHEDKNGQPLSGADTYRLRVPPNAPVKLTGQRPLTIAPPTPLSATSRAEAVRHVTRKRTSMLQWTFTSARRHRRAKSQTGCRRNRAANLRYSSGFTVRRSHSSIRPGSCPICFSAMAARRSASSGILNGCSPNLRVGCYRADHAHQDPSSANSQVACSNRRSEQRSDDGSASKNWTTVRPTERYDAVWCLP